MWCRIWAFNYLFYQPKRTQWTNYDSSFEKVVAVFLAADWVDIISQRWKRFTAFLGLMPFTAEDRWKRGSAQRPRNQHPVKCKQTGATDLKCLFSGPNVLRIKLLLGARYHAHLSRLFKSLPELIHSVRMYSLASIIVTIAQLVSGL